MKKHKIFSGICIVFTVLFVCTGCVLEGASRWFIEVYGYIGFDSILYTLFSDLHGVASDLIQRYLLQSLLPSLLVAAVILFALLFSGCKTVRLPLWKRKDGNRVSLRLYPFHRAAALILSFLFLGFFTYRAGHRVGAFMYVFNHEQFTLLLEDPSGQIALAVSLIMEVIGIFVIKRIVDIDV